MRSTTRDRLARAAHVAVLSAACVGTLLGAETAQADEPVQPTEPNVFRDTAVDLLDVADAFDDRDVFDLNLRLSFEHDQRSAAIRRESAISQPGLTTGGYISDRLDVAQYQESTERLIPEINIGILPEFALKVRMPVILAHNRSLGAPDSGASSSLARAGLAGEQLFQVPFNSPTRSGIEYLAVGLDLGIMSQHRNPHQPNWVMGIEGRFNVSESMHACNSKPAQGQVECAYSADINRNGNSDLLGSSYGDVAGQREGDFNGSRQPGVSRGTTAFEAHAYVSKRYKYVEPYSGVSALFEFPLQSSDYGEIDLESSIVNHPPLRGTVTMGLSVIPWEQPEKYQRISIDFRVRGTYVSEGRDYSELFDALGSSSAPSMRQPNFAQYRANETGNGQPDPLVPSIVDPDSKRVFFTGLTDVQQHGDYDLRVQFTWQAGEYVKFDMGGTFRVIQAHFITFDQACNPNFAGDPTIAGPCKFPTGETNGNGNPYWQAVGIPNGNYRHAINEPGHRFKVDTSLGFGGFIRASVLF